MALETIRIGVPTVSVMEKGSTALPDISAVVPTFSAVTPTVAPIFTSIRVPLPADNYKVMVGLMGYNAATRGYSISKTTAEPGSATTITAGKGILVKIAAGDWPVGFDTGVCAALFLKKGSASSYQLCDYAIIDPNNDFYFLITALPLDAASSFSAALLNSTTTNVKLGDRTPVDGVLTDFKTSGGVTITRDVSQVTVSPDNGPDYQQVTTRAANIQFQSLDNGTATIVRAAGGNYVSHDVSGGPTIELASMSIATAAAVLQGNTAIKFLMPPDSTGVGETRLYIGNLGVNQSQITEPWTKTANTLIQFQLNAAVQDNLLNNQMTEMVYKLTA